MSRVSGEAEQERAIGKRLGNAVRMVDGSAMLHGPGLQGDRVQLCSHDPLGLRQEAGAHLRVVGTVERRKRRMAIPIVQIERLLQALLGLPQSAEIERHHAQRSMGDHRVGGLPGSGCRVQEVLRSLACGHVLGSQQVERIEAADRLQLTVVVAKLARQLECASGQAPDVDGGIAARRAQRPRQPDQHVELQLAVAIGRWDFFQHRKTVLEMDCRLPARGALGRHLAGAAPLASGLAKILGKRQMPRQLLRPGVNELRIARPQHGSHACVELPPLAAQEALVGGVLNERVLERVLALVGRSVIDQQIGLDELLERLAKRVRKTFQHLGQHLIGERAAENGGVLRDLLARVQQVEAGHQRILERGRNGKRRLWRDQHKIPLALQQQL